MRCSRTQRCFLVAAAAAFVAVPPAFSQTGSGQQGRTNRGRPMPSQERRHRQQEMYVQGKVVFEDGTPAPPHVLIERYCGGATGVPQTYTDSKGRFGFELGQLTGFTPDATQSYGTSTPGRAAEELNSLSGMMDQDFPNRLGDKKVTGCSLRAVLPGFRSTTVDVGPRGHFDDPDVGALVLHPLADVEGLGISLVSLQAPEEARESFEKGYRDFEKRKWGNARKHFEEAVGIYPEYAQAWFALGRVHEEDEKPSRAREPFEKASAVDTRFVPPLIGLARLDAREARWDAVATRTEQVLRMNPDDFPEAYFYDAMAHFNRERYPAAERSAREAIARGAAARFPLVVHLLAMSFGYQGQAEEAIAELKRYLEIAPDGPTAPAARQQLAGLEAYVAKQRASAGKPASAPQP